MRKFVLIFITLIGLVGAFAVYFLMQGKFSPVAAENPAAPDQFSQPSGNSSGIFKAGSAAWSKQFDKVGNLSYQFKCGYYDPQPNGTVKVTSPVVQIFLSGGQVMQIEGKDGVVQFPQDMDKGMMDNSPAEPPRYGTLRDVVVKLFDSPDATGGDAQMTMTMSNAEFDNDTYRLFTQEFVDEHGHVWHDDQIPVKVSAKDYSFDGWGLVLYWNDIDKRLKSLVIDHARELTLRDAGNLNPRTVNAPAPAPTSVAAAAVAPAAPAVASASPEATPEPEVRQRYTATFYKNVQVFQGNAQIVKAELMAVDFAARGDGGDTAATTEPATPSSPAAPASSQRQTTTAPTTAPSAPEPIHVYWDGPMRMVPTDVQLAGPLEDGKAIVRMTGSPVTVHETTPQSQQVVDAVAEQIEYRTADASARLRGNVLLKQIRPDGVASTVTAQDLNFSRDGHLARFTGPGKTTMPDPNDPKSILTAAWTDGCDVHFYDLPGDQMEIKDANLQGEVTVNHPKFNLRAMKDVKLSFDSPGGAQKSSSPPLREIIAEGDARCVVHEAKDQNRSIGGETLTLIRDTGPDGKLYARRITCDGDAHAEQEDEEISAGSLTFNLLPTTRKSKAEDDLANDVALDSMHASDNVRVIGKDGSAARADDLRVQMVDDHPHITLVGTADQPAQVRNKTSTITGPVIQLDPHDQSAVIEGPGSFAGLQQPADAAQKPRPVHLQWQQGATLDGNANQVIVSGAVTGGSEDGGDHQSFQCDRLVATLVDVATGEARPKPRKSDAMISDDSDFMRKKQIKALTLMGTDSARSKIESYSLDANGHLVNQRDLLSRTIDINVPSKRLSVNGPGDIVARDAAATTQPAVASSALGGSGQTAIDWKKSFAYDDAAHQAEIRGDITIVHQDLGQQAQSVRLDHAELVHVIFMPEATTRPQKASQPAEPKLKEMIAQGPMTIRSGDKTIYCGELIFDPATQTLDCRRGQLAKVSVVDDNNLNTISYDEAVLDLKTNTLIRMINATGQGQTSVQN